MISVKPLFFSPEPGGRLRCGLCPHRCSIPPGGRGICRVRGNEGGAPTLPFYAHLTALAMDPIEKKPLYHFRPGSQVFSAGFVSCNLRCPFCQNWGISQRLDAEASVLGARELVRLATTKRATAIAYTYSEPLVHIEYLLEAMELAHAAGLANVLVSNGCVLEEAARRVLPLCDAANIDLKAWNPRTYDEVLGGDRGTVEGFLRLAREFSVHLEVTTLVVTNLNDTVEEIAACADFLASLSTDIPYHLSAYRPEYRYTEAPTSATTLRACAEAARRRLSYVYVGNLPGEENDTLCPGCGARVVKRRGYAVDLGGLQEDGDFRCRACGRALPFSS